MTITVYADVLLPNAILMAGVRGRQIRKNTRSQSGSGVMQVNVKWARTQRQYELGTSPLTVDQWQTLEGLFEVTEGGAYGFLMQDPKDTTCATGSGFLQPYTTASIGTIGLGYGVPNLKLYKRYISAGSTRFKDRAITRPLAGPVVKRAGATVVYGGAAGNISLDTVIGTVSFVADTSQAMSSITVGATTVLNFASGTPVVAAFSVGERVYVTGVTGTAASTLNNLSHAITAKGATSLTVSTVTTGLTAAAGSAAKYPQASEAMTWAGGFYVPVHFMSDQIDWELVRSGPVDTRLMSGPSVVLDEVIE